MDDAFFFVGHPSRFTQTHQTVLMGSLCCQAKTLGVVSQKKNNNEGRTATVGGCSEPKVFRRPLDTRWAEDGYASEILRPRWSSETVCVNTERT